MRLPTSKGGRGPMEQYRGFEPLQSVWKTEVLPLHQYCICNEGCIFTRQPTRPRVLIQFFLTVVRNKRLELLCFSTHGPKPCLYANSSNSAYVIRPYEWYWIRTNIFGNSTPKMLAITLTTLVSLIFYLLAISHQYPWAPFCCGALSASKS